MHFYEWWGERTNPGPIGSIEVGGEHEACQCVPLVVARFLFVVAAIPVLWWFAIPYVPLPLWQAAALVVGATLIYVAVSYLFDPQPELSNVGLAHGLIDHPGRYSDDVNRWLFQVKVFFGPGRFVAESLVDMLGLVAREKQTSDSHPQW